MNELHVFRVAKNQLNIPKNVLLVAVHKREGNKSYVQYSKALASLIAYDVRCIQTTKPLNEQPRNIRKQVANETKNKPPKGQKQICEMMHHYIIYIIIWPINIYHRHQLVYIPAWKCQLTRCEWNELLSSKQVNLRGKISRICKSKPKYISFESHVNVASQRNGSNSMAIDDDYDDGGGDVNVVVYACFFPSASSGLYLNIFWLF